MSTAKPAAEHRQSEEHSKDTSPKKSSDQRSNAQATPRGNSNYQQQTPRQRRGVADEEGAIETPRKQATSLIRGRQEPVYQQFTENDGTQSLQLNVSGVKLHVHRDFLVIWSRVFQELLQDKPHNEELAISDVHPDDMVEFLQCLYPPNRPITDDNVDRVVVLASKYETEDLKSKCEEVLLKRKPSVAMVLMAQMYELKRMQEEMARECRHLSLDDLERHEEFDYLDERSKMLLWREHACALEEETEEIEEMADQVRFMRKFIVRKHKCGAIPEDRFQSVTQMVRDERGRKVKATIQGATYLSVEELKPKCRACSGMYGKNCLERMGALENRHLFDAAREFDEPASIHFHYGCT